MIRNMRRRLITIIMILLSIIFISILLAINLMNYSFNIKQQKYRFRHTVYSIGVDAFCNPPEDDSRLEDQKYCSVLIKRDASARILYNNLTDYTEESLLSYSQIARSQPPRSGNFRSLVYTKVIRGNDILIIFSNDGYAWENSKNLFVISSVSGVLGLAILFMLSVYLSRWLTAPALNTLESQKAFISDASHELKTPLTIISSNIDLLESETGSNKQIQYIRSETTRMNTLINEMLTLIRMDNLSHATAHEIFPLTRALLGIALPFESMAYENHIDFRINMEENLEICGNQEQLKRLLSILLDNAFHYVSPQGSIGVNLSRKHKKIFLSVSNTGDPIPVEIQKKIFERFFRADQSRDTSDGHYGLGLSIASSIIEQHQGKIQVTSENGRTEFLVTLPG